MSSFLVAGVIRDFWHFSTTQSNNMFGLVCLCHFQPSRMILFNSTCSVDSIGSTLTWFLFGIVSELVLY